MNPDLNRPDTFTRRHFFARSVFGLGTMGLASLVSSQRAASGAETAARPGGAPARWLRERIGRGTDAVAGAKVWQLTSAAVISHGIYGEQLYCSADGNRVAFLRCYSTDYARGPMELWVADFTTESVLRLGTAALYLVAANPERNTVYYIRRGESDEQALVRVNLQTLEQTVLFTFGKCPPPAYAGLLAISPDERYCMQLRRLGERRYGVERIDLARGEWAVIHEQDDIFNAHLQFSPAGKDLMVQQNRGGLVDENFNVVRTTGPEGATLYVIDQDGKNVRPLPVGKPHTTPITGHETWIGKTGRVVLTTIGGKVYTAAPGDPAPTLVAEMPGLNHIAASADGRFFLVDDFRSGRLFLGSLATTRLLPFCDTGASCGAPQYTHTHPYITPDNRRVIFNSDRTGICQVYAAEIPQGFLDKLAAGEDLKK